MADIRGPILPLQLDPRNTPALVRDTQTKIFLESGGQLNRSEEHTSELQSHS